MTRDETVALFLECEAKRKEARAAALAEGKSEDDARDIAHEAAKAHWNAWAGPLIATRKAMEAEGSWAAGEDWRGALEPKNEETRAWLQAAAADFSRCLFLIPEGKEIKEAAGEDKEESAGDGLPVKSIPLEGTRIDFRGFQFPGPAWFETAAFSGLAWFESAAFSGLARFGRAAFSGPASFGRAAFSGPASFGRAAFSGLASFTSAAFSGDASFKSAAFSGPARFGRAAFSGPAWFESAAFSGDARFRSAAFSGDASFKSAAFSGPAHFEKARFKQGASFALASLKQFASFAEGRFEGAASFYAIRGERGFDMAGAVFEAVPDFIQAHFEEAPRLDNVAVVGRMIEPHPPLAKKKEEDAGSWRGKRWRAARHGAAAARTWPMRAARGAWRRIWHGDGDIPARWRNLKRLAIQGHDTDRELEFHARELRSQRFAGDFRNGDWPVPAAFWRGAAWSSAFRFWFGVFYQIFSDFGRSLARPLAFWALAIVIGATVYVSQSPEIAAARHRQEGKGASAISAAFSRAWHAWLSKPVGCYAGQEPPKVAQGETPPPYVGALSAGLQSGTDPANEAWHLAFRNAFIPLDGSSEAAHRTYGCLYGVELYGGSNPLAVVPGAVSTASAVQKLFSALTIFLFGLALRNMLKMK